MKDQLMKDNLFNFLADIPAYAFIAYANFLQVLPKDYSQWEFFLLKHGWLMLLGLRVLVAFFDLWLRIKGNYWVVDAEGKPRRKSILEIVKSQIFHLLK